MFNALSQNRGLRFYNESWSQKYHFYYPDFLTTAISYKLHNLHIGNYRNLFPLNHEIKNVFQEIITNCELFVPYLNTEQHKF